MPPEVEKQNVHISFQRNRLVVTWATVEMIEYEEEDGVVYRERYEQSHHRTIPLPEGTRVRNYNYIHPSLARSCHSPVRGSPGYYEWTTAFFALP